MTKAELRRFVQRHRLGVLATVSPSGEPESAVVGIAVSDRLEIIFDTLDNTRKVANLRRNSKIAFVIGWDEEITVQLEGLADEPRGAELRRLKEIYFAVYPDGRGRERWKGITYFRVRPHWVRYSDFNAPATIVEFSKRDLSARL
jgi:pyridoxine/pyridoxamine 5'-phosphate oxidase